MTQTDLNKKELLCNLFVFIWDFIEKYLPKKFWTKIGRKSNLDATEAITIFLFWLLCWYKTMAHLHAHMVSYHDKDFNLPCYKNFIETMWRYGREALLLMSIIMEHNRRMSQWRIKYIDATSIAVCKNKRIFTHKVAQWFAKRGMSSMWWFYGFKVHICVDDKWNLLSFTITPGNRDDRQEVKKLVRKIEWIVMADAWYISQELVYELEKLWVLFFSWYKANMRKLVTPWYIKHIKARQIVETGFWMMKCWWNLVSSYARSVWWHLLRMVYNLLGYAVKKLLWKLAFAIS